MTEWINTWMHGDKWTAPYKDMSTNKNRANQLMCIWQERYQKTQGESIDPGALMELMAMVQFALDDADNRRDEKYNSFLSRWTLHDEDGERWNDFEWAPLLDKILEDGDNKEAPVGQDCLTCEELGYDGIRVETTCAECASAKCDSHDECAGCELE